MVSVIIPTLEAERYVERITRQLAVQTMAPDEVLVIDSGSRDGTVAAFREAGVRVVEVTRETFHHGRVRNLGWSEARGEFLVFMTQDAVPADRRCLEKLISPLLRGRASASFARQMPAPDATPLESFARRANYPEESRTVDASHVSTLGTRAYFFSNSFSAVRRDALEGLGGFPTHTIMNEDMLFAARLLRSGQKIAYVADALVEHSHRYSLAQTFKRYFDIGVVFEQARQELCDLPLGRDGRRYVGKLLTHLASEGHYHWIPAAIAESIAKLAGVSLGRRYRRLPLSWTRHLSMHPHYWLQGH
jgi:rhamnosyltransferase